jgi:hypothetical protein
MLTTMRVWGVILWEIASDKELGVPRFFRPSRRMPGHRRLARSRPGLRKLRKAHDFLTQGKYAQAGELFEQLATASQSRGFPRSSHLFLQAGLAQIYGGEAEIGINNVEHGFQIMHNRNEWRKIVISSQRIHQRLVEEGFADEAQLLKMMLATIVPEDQIFQFPSNSVEPKVNLPLKCPQCGGTVHPAEISWIDRQKASCDYCGSVLEATE